MLHHLHSPYLLPRPNDQKANHYLVPTMDILVRLFPLYGYMLLVRMIDQIMKHGHIQMLHHFCLQHIHQVPQWSLATVYVFCCRVLCLGTRIMEIQSVRYRSSQKHIYLNTLLGCQHESVFEYNRKKHKVQIFYSSHVDEKELI